MKKYNVLELFAGAGGLVLGLEQAGFNAVGLIEIDKFAVDTLRKNRPHWNIIHKDIIDVVEKDIKKFIKVNDGDSIDLVSGGFPCQPFSYAGKKLGLNDTRGTLVYYFAEVLKSLKPKSFLAENVKGLLNHNNGQTFKTILNIFENIGYKLSWKVMNALDYGVPQKRQRLVLVGIRNDLLYKSFLIPNKDHKHLTLKDALLNVPDSVGAKYSDKKKVVLSLVPAGGYWKNLPVEIAKKYMGKSYFLGGGKTGIVRRISWDEPSLTLTCSPVQMQTERCHPEEVRPFTTREYARIQTFPDDSIIKQYNYAKTWLEIIMSKYFIFGQVNQKRDKLIYDIAIKRSSMTGLMTKLNNHEILVHTSYGDKKITIGIAHIEFDQQFLDELKEMLFKTLTYVRTTPTHLGLEKDNYIETKPGTIEGMLAALITRWYYQADKIDVLDIAIDLMIRICRSHSITNGNKRLALLSCSVFLNSIGLYLKWSSDRQFYLNYWENLMVDIAKGTYGYDIDDIKKNNEINFNNKKTNIKELFLESLFLNNSWIEVNEK